MRPKQCARWHANIHIVKMIVETAQLLCNVHHRQREHCLEPYIRKSRIPYRESAAGHRKLGSMIWVAESLGNYRWAVQLGLALCAEYNKGRGRAAGKTTLHRTQRVLEWLERNEPNFKKTRRTPVKEKHLAMPPRFKKAMNSVEAYRDYYYSKRKTMEMAWPEGRTPAWWLARKPGMKRKPSASSSVAKQVILSRNSGMKRKPSASSLAKTVDEQSEAKRSRHDAQHETHIATPSIEGEKEQIIAVPAQTPSSNRLEQESGATAIVEPLS